MFDCVATYGSQQASFECSAKSLQQDRNISIRWSTQFTDMTFVWQNMFETRQNHTTHMLLKETITRLSCIGYKKLDRPSNLQTEIKKS